MLLIPTQHYILIPENAEATSYEPHLGNLLHYCDLWWQMYGIDIDYSSVIVREARLNTANDEPYNEVLNWWLYQPEYDVAKTCVVFLKNWDSQKYIGWGGRPLAVVGDYALNRVLSSGSPDAITDDWTAGQLILHEEGHALGLPHDFSDDHLIMSYGHHKFNSYLGQAAQDKLTQLWTPREREDPMVHPEPCIRPAP